MPHRLEPLERRRLFATIKVSDFGARVDDGVADTSAIQSAINASQVGDTVLFDAGRYNVSQVNLKGSRTYQANAGAIVASSSEFAFAPLPDTKDILISGFRFEGAGVGLGAGSFFSNIQIRDNTFSDIPTHAIKLTVGSDGVRIERNTFINIQGYGTIEAFSPNRLSYSYNRIIDSVHGGHILGPLADCKFNYNRMSGIKIMGLEIQRDIAATTVSTNMEVVGNVIWGWKEPAYGAFGLSVIAEAGLNTRIAGNYISNSIAAGSDFDPNMSGPYRQFGPAIEAGFETGVVENNISGGPNTFTTHVGAAGLNMLVRNNKFYGGTGYGTWIAPWSSMYGQGTFIDQNNLKDPNRANMPAVPSIAGDANGDGVVNLLDHNILATNFGKTNATWSQGDFNGDKLVSLQDFNLYTANFGRSA
jgi:hypothetical protein